MSHKLNAAIVVIGIDIGKNSFHVVGLDRRGAIVLRQKWSRGQLAVGASQLGLARGRKWHQLRLLLVPVQGGYGAHPRQRRAEPVLPAWDESRLWRKIPTRTM